MERPPLDERQIYRRMMLSVMMLATIVAFGLILWPFMAPIAWALCLAAVTYAPYRILAARLRRPKVAALIMVLSVPLAIFLPLSFVGVMLVEEVQQLDLQGAWTDISVALNEAGSSGVEGEQRSNFALWLDGLAQKLGKQDASELIGEAQRQLRDGLPTLLSGSMAERVFTLVTAPIVFLFGFLIMLVTLYFVYCEGKRIRRVVMDLSPLQSDETERIIDTLQGTTNAAVMGGIAVAMIQGVLGGAAFAFAGLQAPVLWGLVMGVVSLFPFGGTALVWLPAGIYLLVTGETGSGWFVLIWGALIVGAADNILRPWILTKTGAHDIHPMMLFFATLSGIGLFGISGIVFGPLLLSFVTTVLRLVRGSSVLNDPEYNDPEYNDPEYNDPEESSADAPPATAG